MKFRRAGGKPGTGDCSTFWEPAAARTECAPYHLRAMCYENRPGRNGRAGGK